MTICDLVRSGVWLFFVVPFRPCLGVPPGGVVGAIVSVATLAADRVRVVFFGATLGVVWVFVLEVLRFHVRAGVDLLAPHADLHEVAHLAVVPTLSDFQKTASLRNEYKVN